MKQLFANNILTTLNEPGGVLVGDTVITLTSAAGIPDPTTGAVKATLVRASDSAVEIVAVTAVAGNDVTITRAQEGTTALALVDGDIFALRITAGILALFAQLLTHNTWSGGQCGGVTPITYSATITPDQQDNVDFYCELTGNPTLANFSNLAAGQSGIITFKQDATGTRVPAYGANYKNTQLLSTTPNAFDMLPYKTFDLGGTVYIVFGSYLKNVTGV